MALSFVREWTSPFEKKRREYGDNFFEISGNYVCQFKIRFVKRTILNDDWSARPPPTLVRTRTGR